MGRRQLAAAGGAVAGIALVAYATAGRDAGSSGAGASAHAVPANFAAKASVVLVLIDQLRQDSFEASAPRLNALASKGIVLDQMRSTAPWTYPSVISLMSGLYPQQHGADGDQNQDRLSTFAQDLPLLPGMLRSRGWRTAGFVTNPFLHTWNPFHLGFDRYDVSFIGSQGNLRGAADLVWTANMFADSVNSNVSRHFDSSPLEGPEFTYIHYIDAHGPWDEAPFRSVFDHFVDRRYENSIRFVDEHVSEMYEYFLERYAGNLLFIVTSDHGRALADDEKQGVGKPWRSNKKSPHDFNLRVPFVVLPSARMRLQGIVSEPASNIDLVPTLLAWLELPDGYVGPGRNLLPAIRAASSQAGARSAPRDTYARMSAFGFRSDSVVSSGIKVIRHFDLSTGGVEAVHAYDLALDPDELAPLESISPDAQLALEAAAASQGIEYPSHFDVVEDELKSQLNALGYLE